MATTVYKSSDASAPQMTSAAGSLLTVLDACLVNGYGAKPAAGWSKTVVDAGTHQAYYRQGAKAGFAQRLWYIKDDAATPGNATSWACSACTVAASPVLTNNFWDQGSGSIGVLLKADQDNGGVAEWLLIANERACMFFTRRSGWGERGWAMTFVGDLDVPYMSDLGCFSVLGRNSGNGAIALGAPPPLVHNSVVRVYGDLLGTYLNTSYTWKKAMGDGTQRAESMALGSLSFYDILLTSMDISDTSAFRGRVPWLWTTVQSYAFSYYALPEGYEMQGAGSFSGTTFKLLHFDASNQTKYFFETAGFTT